MEEAARRATPADHDALLQLALDARSEAIAKRGGLLLIDRELVPAEIVSNCLLSDPDRVAMVGTIDEVVVGYALCHREVLHSGASLAVVDELYVDPEARAVGIGELIMDDLLVWARGAECIGIDARALPGDRQTKNFFETFGLVARQIVVHRSLRPSEDDQP